MIFATDKELEIGSVSTPSIMKGEYGQPITPQPMYIIRKATLEEYCQQSEFCRMCSGNLAGYDYFYEVSVD